jgi:hypothetical protein
MNGKFLAALDATVIAFHFIGCAVDGAELVEFLQVLVSLGFQIGLGETSPGEEVFEAWQSALPGIDVAEDGDTFAHFCGALAREGHGIMPLSETAP